MAPDVILADILELVDRYGWAVVSVGGSACRCPGCGAGRDTCEEDEDGEGDGGADGTQFSYTVGLTTAGFPEVITYGLPREVAAQCLNLIGERVGSGRPPRVGATVDRVFTGGRGYLLEATDVSDLVVADQIYPELTAAQLVWSDPAGRFPWQGGYQRRRWRQRLIGPPPRHQRIA